MHNRKYTKLQQSLPWKWPQNQSWYLWLPSLFYDLFLPSLVLFFFKAKVLYLKKETFLEIYFRNSSNVNDLIQTEDSKKINI